MPRETPKTNVQIALRVEVRDRLREFVSFGSDSDRVRVLLDGWELLTPEQRAAVLEKKREVAA